MRYCREEENEAMTVIEITGPSYRNRRNFNNENQGWSSSVENHIGDIMHPRVLIVGTVPYNKKSTSRAFEAYFHNWEKEHLAQIFSNTKKPCKGHCGTLFQITDQRILKRWLSPKVKTGKIFEYDQLADAWADNSLEVDSAATEAAYRLGAKHTPLTHLLRGLLWRKRFWCTTELNAWLDDFRPECVFLSFSDDYFIPQIARYVAKRYNIPIVSSIGDDYYFNKHFSLSPLYQLYKETYKALIRKVLAYPGSAIYISDKIRDQYNRHFGLDGETVYLTSEVVRKPYVPISKQNPLITYFGNIRMGRNTSLNEIARALGEIDPNYKLEVYSNESDPAYIRDLEENPNVIFGGSIPYADVQEKIAKSDITVIVEGFQPKDIEQSRYSLSTKAADALASGAAILAYGSEECGIIEYMQSTEAAVVCTQKTQLVSKIQELLDDETAQKIRYEQAIKITNDHHNLESSCAVFEKVVMRALGKRV